MVKPLVLESATYDKGIDLLRLLLSHKEISFVSKCCTSDSSLMSNQLKPRGRRKELQKGRFGPNGNSYTDKNITRVRGVGDVTKVKTAGRLPSFGLCIRTILETLFTVGP